MKYRLLISYDGTDFEGWQRQSGNKPTIQGTLETLISKICNERISLIGSGRTDSGVHAMGQVAHFSTNKELKPSFLRAINSLVPESIGVLKAYSAPDEFHAQRSAISKTYLYKIHNSEIPNPLKRHYSTWLKKQLNVEKLNEICKPLVGEHDFKSFQTTGTELKSTVRTITTLEWVSNPKNPVEITLKISGSGFLKQMVRNIVGTALYLHQNKGSSKEMLSILKQLDRRAAKTTAPPTGLYLHCVDYPSELDKKCLEL